MRYHFYVAEKEHKIICTSTFAGKTVRGIAKCSPNDNWNIEKGKELAKLRCDLKVAEKRMVKANNDLLNAKIKMAEAENWVLRKEAYVDDAVEAWHKYRDQLQYLEATI